MLCMHRRILPSSDAGSHMHCRHHETTGRLHGRPTYGSTCATMRGKCMPPAADGVVSCELQASLANRNELLEKFLTMQQQQEFDAACEPAGA